MLFDRKTGFSTRGFTLVEMMIVVAIIAILAAFLTPSVSKYMHRSKGQSAARSVVNALRAGQNQALSRGEVVLATISTVNDAALANSGGRVQLFVTNNYSDECDATNSAEMRETNDPDCFARTCAQAQGMAVDDRTLVHTVDFGETSPDMIISGTDPEATDGQRTFCFSPSGRVLELGGQTIEPTGTGCDGTNARIFVRSRAEGDLAANPIYSAPTLTECVDVSSGSDEATQLRQQQKDGRDVANFYAIYVSYNGAISLRQ